MKEKEENNMEESLLDELNELGYGMSPDIETETLRLDLVEEIELDIVPLWALCGESKEESLVASHYMRILIDLINIANKKIIPESLQERVDTLKRFDYFHSNHYFVETINNTFLSEEGKKVLNLDWCKKNKLNIQANKLWDILSADDEDIEEDTIEYNIKYDVFELFDFGFGSLSNIIDGKDNLFQIGFANMNRRNNRFMFRQFLDKLFLAGEMRFHNKMTVNLLGNLMLTRGEEGIELLEESVIPSPSKMYVGFNNEVIEIERVRVKREGRIGLENELIRADHHPETHSYLVSKRSVR